jgi:hypothetical protein|tara:strand:+ start:235 stop:375 length:141 start_codon:yes stop_codon:yes gene_type:complete
MSTKNNNTQLADRVTTLERELAKTRKQVQQDMQRLIEIVNNNRKDQ